MSGTGSEICSGKRGCPGVWAIRLTVYIFDSRNWGQ